MVAPPTATASPLDSPTLARPLPPFHASPLGLDWSSQGVRQQEEQQSLDLSANLIMARVESLQQGAQGVEIGELDKLKSALMISLIDKQVCDGTLERMQYVVCP